MCNIIIHVYLGGAGGDGSGDDAIACWSFRQHILITFLSPKTITHKLHDYHRVATTLQKLTFQEWNDLYATIKT